MSALPFRVDTGDDPFVPMILNYSKKKNMLSAVFESSAVEPALLLAMTPEQAVTTVRGLTWMDMYRTGKVNALHLMHSEWKEKLTRETCRQLGITMKALIQTGLTWAIVARAGLKPKWYVEIVGATRIEDFESIPGELVSEVDWTQDEIEEALELPLGAILL